MSDYLSLLQNALVNSQNKQSRVPSVQFSQGMVAGKIASKDTSGIDYSQFVNPEAVGGEAEPYSTGLSGILSDVTGIAGNVVPYDWGARALDVLSRPNFAMNNMRQEALRRAFASREEGQGIPGQILAGWSGFSPGQAWQGLSGEQKVTGAQVVEEAAAGLGKDPETLNRPLKGVLGLGLDIFGDPTTYVGPGVVKSALKGLKGGEVTASALESAKSTLPKVNLLPGSAGTATKTIAKPKSGVNLLPAADNVAADVPDVKIPEFDQMPQMVTGMGNYTLPVPIGQHLGTTTTVNTYTGPREILTREGAVAQGTHLINSPGPESAHVAQETANRAQDYLDNVFDRELTTPAEHAAAYEQGVIRPVLDTPAEKEFMFQLSKELRGETGVRSTGSPEQEFSFLDQATQEMLTKPSRGRTMVEGDTVSTPVENPTVSVKNLVTGKTMDIPSDKLWDALHGKTIQIEHSVAKGSVKLKPTQVAVKRAGETKYTPVSKIAAENRKALKSNAYWKDAAAKAEDRIANPQATAEQYARSQLQFLKSQTKRAKESLDDWLTMARREHPELSDATLKKAYAAGQKLLSRLWEATKVVDPNPAVFFRNQAVANEVHNIMASAIARHATPEELMTDIAIVQQRAMQNDAQSLIDIAKENAVSNPEYAAAAADQADELLQEGDTLVKTADEAEQTAKVKRVFDSEGNEINVRKADVTNSSGGEVEAILRFGGGSAKWVDSATGAVKSIVNNTLESIRKGLTGKSDVVKGKRQPFYNEMKQTKALTASKQFVDKYAHGKMPPKTYIQRVIQVMRAVEHQLNNEGFFPNVWNKKYGKEAKNLKFSGAELLDDAIGVSDDLARAMLDENFNNVLYAAMHKGDALKAIKDNDLREFLKNYDVASNVERVNTIFERAAASALKSAAKIVEEESKKAAVADSRGRQAMGVAEASSKTKEAIKNTPGAPVEVSDAAGDVAKNTATKTVGSVTYTSKAAKATEANKSGLVSDDPIKQNAASQAVSKASGNAPPKVGELSSVDNLDTPWVQRFKQLFNNHSGAKYARPMMQNNFNYLMSYVSASSRDWRNLAKQFSEEDMLSAIRSMRLGSIEPVTEGAREAQRVLRKRMEDVFGGSQIRQYIKGNTTVTKAGITREQLNKWVRQKAVRDADGKIFQFGRNGEDAKGIDWLTEWENELPKFKTANEGMAFMHNLESAVYSASVERMLFDDFAVKYAAKAGTHTVGHPYLQGVAFDKEMALEGKRMAELIDVLQHPPSANKFLATYDQILRLWKTGVTIYNPSHHIRNFTGDSFLYYADGGKTKNIGRAATMLNRFTGSRYDLSQLDQYDSMARGMSVRELGDIQKLKDSVLNGPTEGRITFKTKGTDIVWSDDQIMAGANLRGMFQGAGNLEDIMKASRNYITQIGEKFPRAAAPFGGKVHDKVTSLAEGREHLVRTAHFIHAVENTTVKRLKGMSDADFRNAILDDAANRVRKMHPDGMDMTGFERSVMRRVVPFYSWQRKSIPLIMGIAAHRPGFILYYPKAEYAYSVATGNLDPGDSNNGNIYLPGNELLPDFVTANTWAVVGQPNEGGLTLAQGPSTPPMDLLEMMNNPSGSVKGMLTPALNIPMTLMAGKDPRTGAPVETLGDKAEYVGEQVPGVANAVRWGTSQQPLQNSFLNWATAMGFFNTKPYEDVAYNDAKRKYVEGR